MLFQLQYVIIGCLVTICPLLWIRHKGLVVTFSDSENAISQQQIMYFHEIKHDAKKITNQKSFIHDMYTCIVDALN